VTCCGTRVATVSNCRTSKSCAGRSTRLSPSSTSVVVTAASPAGSRTGSRAPLASTYRLPCALGLDLSPAAIARAKLESLDVPNVDFRALDATTSAVGRDLLSELGECNVFVRGVFHVLGRAAQLSLAENLGPLVGVRGRLFLAETNFPGSQLAYLAHLGATPWRIPAPLERAIADLPKPGHFGHCELRGCFPEAEWKIITAGETTIETVPMRGGTDPELIPGYYALLAHHGRAD